MNLTHQYVIICLITYALAFDICVSVVEGQSRKKTWVKNTNFGNLANWDGFTKDCSKNIYTFPPMEPTVILLPENSTIRSKEIILPRNGILLFQRGLTTLFNSPSDTCQGVELIFRRTTREDWFDPDNWIESDSLLSKTAIPHVELVPCQYDMAKFPSKTSFNLFISSDVALHKFLLGEEDLTYEDIAMFMNSRLGKLQFQKHPDTLFDLIKAEWEDNDKFICRNYKAELKQKICSLADCKGSDGDVCSNPVTPHGFCCPICGFHLIIQHSGEFRLSPVRTKLSTRLKSLNLANAVATHTTRSAPKWAHIVFIPWMNKTGDVRKLIDEIRSFLHDDSSVEKTTLLDSWSGTGADKLTSGDIPSSGVVLIIILILLTIGGSFIFYWNKRGHGQPLTFNSVLSRLPRMPNITLPRMPIINFPGVGLNARIPSFAFERFSNERVSSINIGQMGSGRIERTDKVDDTDIKPIDMEMPEGISQTGIGFVNIVYDIIGVGGNTGATSREAELNKNSSSAIANEEHVYDLVEVNGGSNSALADYNNIRLTKNEE